MGYGVFGSAWFCLTVASPRLVHRLLALFREWFREFGHRLRVTRIALGLTEAEAAKAAARSVRTWQRYEATGRGYITAPILLFAERYHNVNID